MLRRIRAPQAGHGSVSTGFLWTRLQPSRRRVRWRVYRRTPLFLQGYSRIGFHQGGFHPHRGWRLGTSFYGHLFPHISRVSPRVACGRHAPIGSQGTIRVAARVWPSLASGSHVDQARVGPRPPGAPSESHVKTFIIPSGLSLNSLELK